MCSYDKRTMLKRIDVPQRNVGLSITNKETQMLKSRSRMLVRVVGFAVMMIAAPVAFGTTGDPGLQVNNACAEDGGCCFEMGSICKGMTNRGACPNL